MRTFSSREFNQNVRQVRKALSDGPVLITSRAKPVMVVLSYEDYQKLAGTGRSFEEMLAFPGDPDIEFDPPKLGAESFIRPAELE